jgi:hypothetical protein
MGISPRRAAKVYRIVPKSEWKGADPCRFYLENIHQPDVSPIPLNGDPSSTKRSKSLATRANRWSPPLSIEP